MFLKKSNYNITNTHQDRAILILNNSTYLIKQTKIKFLDLLRDGNNYPTEICGNINEKRIKISNTKTFNIIYGSLHTKYLIKIYNNRRVKCLGFKSKKGFILLDIYGKGETKL